MKWIERVPWWLLILAALLLAIAPYPREPAPHLIQKVHMLMAGTLTRPLDIFDLFLHGLLFPLLIVWKWIYQYHKNGNDH